MEKPTDRDLTMKPPLFVDKMIRDLESDLMFGRTAPWYISTMRLGDGAYEFAEMQLKRLKKEQFYELIKQEK